MEFGGNVQEVARRANGITSAIARMSETAKEKGAAYDQVLSAASELAE